MGDRRHRVRGSPGSGDAGQSAGDQAGRAAGGAAQPASDRLCEHPGVVTSGGKRPLTEVATEVLSKTWFGEPQSGELCYSLRSNMRHRLSEVDLLDHLATCPVTIRNASDEPLDFQRFCLRVQHLSLFQGNRGLQTNGVEVIARGGGDRPTEVNFLADSLPGEELGECISAPRVEPAQSLLRRSFGKLMSFGGL